MEQRIGAIAALIAFAMCLAVGAFEARNPFGTVLWRSLVAMFWSYVVGYLVGMAAERMMRERRAALEKKSEHAEGTTADGR